MTKKTMARFTLDNITIETNWQTLKVNYLYPFDIKQISTISYGFRNFTVELLSTKAEKTVLTPIHFIDIQNGKDGIVSIRSTTSSFNIAKEDIALIKIIVEDE